jgi:hypothetical protein
MEQAAHETEEASPPMSLATLVVHETQDVVLRTILSHLPHLVQLSYPAAALVELTDSDGALHRLGCLHTEAL